MKDLRQLFCSLLADRPAVVFHVGNILLGYSESIAEFYLC